MVQTDCSKLKRGAFEETVDNGVSTHLVAWTFKEEGTHRWMMRDLLCDKAVVGSYYFIGFTQKGIEGFSCSSKNFGVLSYQEASYIASSFNWVLFSNSFIHQFVERCNFRDFLKHTNRLIKPNGHRDLGHVLSNCTLKDRPHTVTLVFWY